MSLSSRISLILIVTLVSFLSVSCTDDEAGKQNTNGGISFPEKKTLGGSDWVDERVRGFGKNNTENGQNLFKTDEQRAEEEVSGLEHALVKGGKKFAEIKDYVKEVLVHGTEKALKKWEDVVKNGFGLLF